MKLIDDWKQSWRFLSVQFNVLGIFILSILMELPNHMLSAWFMLPPEFKDVLNKDMLIYLSMIFMSLSVAGRIVSQAKRGELTDKEDIYSIEAKKEKELQENNDIKEIV